MYKNDLITLEPRLGKNEWEYYPESINRIAIYDIETPSQPVLKDLQSPTMSLDAISKIPEQQNSTSKSDKAIEIKIMTFVTNNESSKVLKPREKTFNFPSSFITS